MNATKAGRRIDAHVHLWKIARGDYDWMSPDLGVLYRDYTVADLVPLLDRAGVQQVVLVQAAATEAETEFLLEIAAASDRVAGVVGWVDLAAPTAAASLRRLAASPWLKGVRPMVQFIPDPDWILREDLAAGWDAVADLGLALDCLVTPVHLRQLHRLLTSRPQLRAVIDHGAKPAIAQREFDEWAALMTQLAKDTSAFCKVSGLVTEAGSPWSSDDLRPYVNHLVEQFGPRRLLFGSDWPVLNLASDYETWFRTAESLLAGLTPPERTAVLGGNAARAYRL
jgi:L-fuconolactonase